jgi:hypothetical protein
MRGYQGKEDAGQVEYGGAVSLAAATLLDFGVFSH